MTEQMAWDRNVLLVDHRLPVARPGWQLEEADPAGVHAHDRPGRRPRPPRPAHAPARRGHRTQPSSASSRSLPSARDTADFTVPTDTPSTSAVCASERSS